MTWLIFGLVFGVVFAAVFAVVFTRDWKRKQPSQ
jgi:hypothetical protein